MLSIEPATLEHGMAMSPFTRSESCCGLPPAAAARIVLEASTRSYTLMGRSGPVLLWGVTSPSQFSSYGYLWALVSDKIAEYPVAIGRLSKQVVEKLRAEYDTLEVTTDPNYELANKWVRWLGFKEVAPRTPNVKLYILEKNNGS